MRIEFAAAALAVAFLAWAGMQDAAAPAPALVAFHYDSAHDPMVADARFQEVFCVSSVRPGSEIATADVNFTLDGVPERVYWEDHDGDGLATAGDRFWYFEEAFDQLRLLEAEVDGEVVWSLRYGGGSANPVRACV